MTNFLSEIHSLLWGAPALVIILGVGLYYSWKSAFVQLRWFPLAFRQFLSKFLNRQKDVDGISPFQALCTALAATVGTGNLVGVSGAICLGGPGAIFWMWICGIIGMMTKFAEVTLAVHYRVKIHGVYTGGPMYMISTGLDGQWHWLASVYAVLGVVAAFGVGNATQINALIGGINDVFGFETERRNLAFGLILAVMTGAVMLGGARGIGMAAEKLVPFVSLVYILLCTGVLVINAREIPTALYRIVKGAFCPQSVTGGVIGAFFCSLRTGCSRGVFTNEAGMGTASIAHASANTHHPIEQGLMGIMEVFLDTILICTLTALVILTSGVSIPYGCDVGGLLTSQAFCSVYGAWARLFLALSLCCFAFATILGWGVYGACCAQFLFGPKAWFYFSVLQAVMVIPGAVLPTQTIWLLAEIFNGLMAIPNLIALAVLSPVFFRLMIDYKRKTGIFGASGGNYADFHQCKPL